jgi:8-oxo-dGTP pyrophosphatase MutT (NUDIX family)
MPQCITVYFDAKPFVVTDHLTAAHQQWLQTAGTVYVNHPTLDAVRQCIHDLDATAAKAAIIFTDEVGRFWTEFQSRFTPITAGGGLVINGAGHYLFMLRRGLWDLPKGKQDEGETIDDCALREVQEETGLKSVTLGQELTTTWHTYHQKQKFYLKKTVWFRMQSTANEALIPQAAEDITDLRWLSTADLAPIYDGLFPSIKDVLAAANVTV